MAALEQQRYTCAIGALQSVVAIPGALPILHSGPGCGEMVSNFFEFSSGTTGGATSPCTNFSENEVVFGGEQRLEEVIRHSYDILKSDLQVVLTGCTAAIVGDDVKQVAAGFAGQGKPIVYLDTPGFKCSNLVAHEELVIAIVEQYVKNAEKRRGLRRRESGKRVNLFASVPSQDPLWKGNLIELKKLIEATGLSVNVLFGSYSKGVGEWETIPEANFNVLVSSWCGLSVVEYLEREFSQPYFHFPYFPIGGNETTKFLREVFDFAARQDAGLDAAVLEEYISEEENAFYDEMDTLATFLLEFRYGLPSFAHIIGNSEYVIGISKFLLNEVGIVPKEQFIADNPPEQHIGRLRALVEGISDTRKIEVFIDPDAGKAQERIAGLEYGERGLLIGSGWDKKLAIDKSYDFLPLGVPSLRRLPLTARYVGYAGGLRLIEDIYDRVLDTY